MIRLLFDAFDGSPAKVKPNRLRVVASEVHVVFEESSEDDTFRSTTIKRRSGDRLPLIAALAYTAAGPIDLTQFASIAFRMVSGATIVTGTATGDAVGNLRYSLGPSDTAIGGTYSAYFIATDHSGKIETFPSGENLTVFVV